ncbi:nitroreductase family protein [Krasilnikovia sp. MM14-A1004]|uniref:nitroreductase family protein n=1 Tax=Krasilnikovia sp. MM14-A1004 TaxID=3373541 RepID=UPI00399C645F
MTLPLTPDELLTTTRTVRKRLDLTRPVPVELVRECVEIALQAPSGSNEQSWHFMVVTDADKRAAVGEIYRQQVARYAESNRFAGRMFADRPERSRVQERVGDSVLWLGEHMGQVPVLVIPCLRTGKPVPAGNQAGLWGSLLPAAWSYCLAARSRGLATAWTTLHLGQEAEVARILGIPDGVHQGALLPTAYFTGTTFRPAEREPVESVWHENTW